MFTTLIDCFINRISHLRFVAIEFEAYSRFILIMKAPIVWN